MLKSKLELTSGKIDKLMAIELFNECGPVFREILESLVNDLYTNKSFDVDTFITELDNENFYNEVKEYVSNALAQYDATDEVNSEDKSCISHLSESNKKALYILNKIRSKLCNNDIDITKEYNNLTTDIKWEIQKTNGVLSVEQYALINCIINEFDANRL